MTPAEELRAAAGSLSLSGRRAAAHEAMVTVAPAVAAAVADVLTSAASRYDEIAGGPHGAAGAVFVSGADGHGDLDPALAVARAYLGTGAAPSFTCPKCGMTSYNPTDIREAYCGNCHSWTAGQGGNGHG